MASIFKSALSAIVITLLSTASYAQVCKETGSNSSSNSDNEHGYIDCDMAYRDTIVTCSEDDPDNDKITGTRPSCPAKPMPMVETPNKSPIADYSPYLYAYARDAADPSKAYNGTFSVGTAGGPGDVFNMIATPSGNVKRLTGCVPQIKFNNQANNVEEEAKRVRLELDNCTNQYILFAAMYPFQKERARLINNPDLSSKPISLKTECQPINTFSESENEYDAGEYLETAWKKLLQDPSHRKNRTSWAEPHLPRGMTLQNPISPPVDSSGKSLISQVRLSQIASVKYEEIVDPSHPFSPRWDFSFNERERYSPLTDEYMEDTKNAVYCAGVREAKNENDKKKKEDLEVKVDVLKFRQKAFQTGILKRIAYNTACKKDSGDDVANFFKNMMTSYCHKTLPYWYTWIPCIVGDCDPQSKRVECWECFKLDGKVDDEKQHPPCATRHDGKDLKIKGKTPGLFNGGIWKASCNPPPFFFRQKKHNIDKLCRDLRRPYTQINKLKMRYHNPDDKDYNAMKDGVPEGYTFKEYFGNHMPYPRLWDTGSSLQKTNSADGNDQPADDTKGQYTAIVGVGREGAIDKASDDDKKKHPDERCKLGGWGGSTGFPAQAVAGFGQGMDGGLGGFGSQFGGANTGDAGQGFDFQQYASGFQDIAGFSSFQDNGLSSFGSGGSGSSGVGGGASGGMNFGGFTDGILGGLGDNLGGGSGFGNTIDSAMSTNGVRVGNHTIRVPDGITSWTELKLYQTRTLRTANISCLGRYEKVFKPGGTENLALMSAGGEWSQTIVQRCPNSGSSSCTFMTLKDYQNNNNQAANTYTIPQIKQENWPLAWRGYISTGTGGSAGFLNTGNDPNQFPNFGGSGGGNVLSGLFGSGTMITGLDKAELGDIVLMPRGGSSSGRKPGLAKVGIIGEVSLGSRCASTGNCHVKIFEADNGKWPDVCGTTDSFGELKSRYFYKSYNLLPKDAREEYTRIKSTSSCEDTKLLRCVFEEWDNIKLYRIRKDERAGCNKEKSSECE